ncbi:MAG: cysteine dioxygenase family protein [Bdellovibrionales bacterium]|nr:cysteine dioxygenase family protein [Bdellovibrionales bacterium]
MKTLDDFLKELDGLVRSSPSNEVVPAVERLLSQLGSCEVEIPGEKERTRDDRYARYCLALPEDRAYSVILMAWAPGQGGPIHDHDRLWCVECVLRGEMKITRYDPKEVDDAGRVMFAEHETIVAGKGETGHLIPPLEYHRMQNASADIPAYTLHVYGGEMKTCTTFVPERDGFCRRECVRYHSD